MPACAALVLPRTEWLDKNDAWRPFVPMVGILLVVLVLLAYALSMRFEVAMQWCEQQAEANKEQEDCYWCRSMIVHDCAVAYLGTMILFHYIVCVFRSPGIVLSKSHSSCTWWNPWRGQGGVVGLHAMARPSLEASRAALYGRNNGNLGTKNGEQSSIVEAGAPAVQLIPSPHWTFCTTCQHARPPRCRHCSSCRRCVLQYDHHCVWVNQCIGYSNYRYFLLMLFYFSLGCWYGSFLLARLFVKPILEGISGGGFYSYLKKNSFMMVPAPFELLSYMIGGRTELAPSTVIGMVYPLLFCLALILSAFFWSHLKMAAKARTTLDQNMIDEYYTAVKTLVANNTAPNEVPNRVVSQKNPFDLRSATANLQQIFGFNIIYCFLPVIVDPPPPYIPQETKAD